MADFRNTLSLNGTSVSVVGHTHLTTNLTDLASSGIQLKHGFPVPYVVTLSYSAVNRQITLTPSGGTFDVWLTGVKFTKTGAQTSTAHANTTGNYFIYYDASGVLQVSVTPWEINSANTPVCYVYYNSSLIDGIALFELHTAGRSLEWHESQHFLTGTFLRSGLEISGYTLNSDVNTAVTFGLAAGIIVDEDIEYTVNTLADNGPYFILNRVGVSEFTWTTANILPYRYGATYIQYNQNNGGTWQLTELTSTDYVNYYVFATTAIDSAKRIVVVPGQSKFTTLTLAQGENVASLNWGSFAITEICAVWKLTYQARSTYTGVTGRTRLIEVSKLNLSKSQLSGSFTLGAHNTLSSRDALETHPASSISNIPAGNISAIDVQAAINELDSEKLALTGGTLTGDITTYRSAEPTTGVIYLGNTGNKYLYFNGTEYNLPGANLYVNSVQAVTNSGTWSISVTGNSATTTLASRIKSTDLQATVLTPSQFGVGADFVFMQNSTDGLSDGGSYHGVMQFQPYADASGGGAYELGFTGNNNLWIRGSSHALTAWASWKKIIDDSVYTAADILTKLKTVDGTTSGLDADLLDGNEASVFALKISPVFAGMSTFTYGDNSNSYINAQIAFGYNGGSAYPHFIHTRHMVGSVNLNAIDFYTSDGTSSGVFPTNAFHNLSMNGGNVGVGIVNPSAKLHSYSTSEQLRLGYDATKYCTFTVNDSGNMTLVPSGGTLSITGTLYATAKSFKIDHPSKENYYLQYGSLESPYHGIRLTGKSVVIKGECKVELPDYISDLVNIDNINIQITNIGHSNQLYVQDDKLRNNSFTILCDSHLEDLKFFWTFTAIRKDVDNIQVEIMK